MYNELITELRSREKNLIVKAVDISSLSEKESRGYKYAIILGIVLNPEYVYNQLEENSIDRSEFCEKEHLVDELAEWAADFITKKGYKAFAQSEKNLLDRYNVITKTSHLPHKKVSVLAGMGWIGKSNLMVTHDYGSAICMCTVLTNAPCPTENKSILTSNCGTCTICMDVCPTKVIHGVTWEKGIDRDLLVDVYHCEGCLKCLINCQWSKKYAKRGCNVR